MRMALISWLVLLATAPAHAQPAEDNTKELRLQLGRVSGQLMDQAYICQKYVGGMDQFHAAKRDIELTLMQIGVAREKAATALDQDEENLVKRSAEAMAKLDELANADAAGQQSAVKGCTDSIQEARDQVKALKARLGLL